MFVMLLSCWFLAALWSHAGKGPASWLSCVAFSCVFVTFPYGVLGQVLIVSIPDLCLSLYFYNIRVTTCDFRQFGILTSVDSDKPV